MNRFFVVTLHMILVFQSTLNAAPYPASDLISTINLDWSTHKRGAVGSDNFQLTWSDDGNQYGAWGDGNGFDGSRVSIGVAKISGDGNSWTGTDVWYGDPDDALNVDFSGKSWGMISVGGTLYMWFVPDIPDGETVRDHYAYIELAKSTDHGKNWVKADWKFLREEGLSIPTFLNFGQDNAGARDSYVYSYFIDPLGHVQEDDDLIVHKPGKVYLARVKASDIWKGKSYYQWYKGDSGGGTTASWGTLAEKTPVFADAEGVGWCMSATHIRGLDRYVLCTEHGQSHSGVMGIFEAPEPWGPWRTVKYWSVTDYFGRVRTGDDLDWENNVFFIAFSPRWQSGDGTSFTLTFTGGGRGSNNDSFNTLSGTFSLVSTAPGTTGAVTGLTVGSGASCSWGTLSTGTEMYVDRDYTYTSVPSALEGGTVLRTANDDKLSSASAEFITFSVIEDVTVYVLYTRVNTTLESEWLTSVNGWQTAGHTVETTLDGDETVRLVKYKNYSAGGTVSLNGNGGTGAATSMYTVAVVPGSTTGQKGTERSPGMMYDGNGPEGSVSYYTLAGREIAPAASRTGILIVRDTYGQIGMVNALFIR